MLLGTQRVNDLGRLEIGGCDTVELAKRFGTPLYVMDEAALREACRAYRKAFESRYDSVLVSFAGKAFLNMAACVLADQEGLGLDVASGGELYTALHACFPTERILMHGNFKSAAELEMALQHGVGRLVVDCVEEIALLQQITAAQNKTADILLRVTPGVAADTHTFIQTGKVDSKFGFSIASGAALEAVGAALACPNIRLQGVHCHIGSQIFDLEPFVEAAHLMVDFMAQVRERYGLVLADLDLGGGLAVRYLPEHNPPSVDQFAETTINAVTEACAQHNLPLPRLILEPGRSLVGEAGTTLYTIGVIKEIPEVRTYVAVDGGLSDNPRPALYDAKYSAIVANKATASATKKVTVSGKHCETDTLIEGLMVPELEPGDILAVQTTGAYNYAMASNYNRFLRPAVVLVNDGTAEEIVARESFDDLIRCDRIPPRLRKA